MSEGLLGELRTTTADAKTKNQERGTQAAITKRQNEEAREQERQKRMAQFVSEALSPAIEEVTNLVRAEAAKGKTTANKQWRIKRGEHDPEPTDELDKYRKLRDAVSDHFTELGIVSSSRDYRESYEDRSWPSDEGYWPSVYTDHMITIYLSWSESSAEQ